MNTRELLELIPQQKPFRFVDEIVEVNDLTITGRYTFRPDESFYAGHFPGNPVTPGVILLESMCQVGVVALGIYLLSKEESPEEVRRWTTMFADAQVEFMRPVFPGTTVTVKGEKVFWRRKKLRSRVEMFDAGGNLVAQATASGIGVKHEQ
ncbi:MAG: 3-hydroxyacyl-ACP dehydratase FabZ family protein [Bdellovibrionota bacterium]